MSFEYSGDQPILVTIAEHEATVDSKISNDSGQLLNHAYFDFRRGVPLFQLLEPTESGTRLQLDFEITRATTNSFLEISAFALPATHRLDEIRIEAYRLYSDSVQKVDSYDRLVWSKRMENLQHASQLFGQVGLEREQLWSGFLAAVLAYFPMADVETSLVASEALFERSRDMSLNDIAVMAFQLKGQCYMYRGIVNDDENSARNIQQSIVIFEEAADFAGKMGQDFQRAWALNNIGVAYFYLDKYEQSISSHLAGLRAGEGLDDPYLNDVINSNIAAAMQGLGDYEGVTSMLLKIAASQRSTGQTMELAFSLDRLGHTYAKLYQFDKAVTAYSEALQIAINRNDYEMAGLMSVSLGDAYFELGYFENALEYLKKAIELLEPINGGFGLKTAHATAAKIYRLQGDTTKMETHRKQQKNYLQSELDSAQYTFELGIDALDDAKNAKADAIKNFQQSYSLGKKLANESLILFSQMHLCLQQSLDKEECSVDRLGQHIMAFTANAKPREKLEALKLWADYLILQDLQSEAMTVLVNLLNEIQFYRSNLSGVMGAWYWQSRTDVFQKLMNLQITLDQQSDDGTDSFLLLNRLHAIASGNFTTGVHQTGEDAYVGIRSLMAQMENAKTDEQRSDIEHNLQFELLKLPAGSRFNDTALDSEGMASLQASLPSDAAILAFYFSDPGIFAWIADAGSIKLVQISTTDSLVDEITRVMDSFRIVGNDSLDIQLDTLGMHLLGPVIPYLKETIYFIPGGPLNGFPIDALRYEGKFLAENHIVVNLQSLDSFGEIFHDKLKVDSPFQVLLAGNPISDESALPELKGSLTEIEEIANVFADDTVIRVSGEQFNRGVIMGEQFSSARVIHIASHGILNLKYPELSEITLSQGNDSVGDFLIPQDLSPLEINAELVVLSACETGGLNTFQFESNLGFVSEFLAKGANNVIASLFPVSDESTASFMLDYYLELNRSRSISKSLGLTKRKYMKSTPPRDWASFQLSRR